MVVNDSTAKVYSVRSTERAFVFLLRGRMILRNYSVHTLRERE